MMDTVKTVGVALMGLALMVAVLNGVFGVFLASGADVTHEETISLNAEGVGDVPVQGLGVGVQNFSANQSLGTAAAFTGEPDSYASSTQSISVSDSPDWTVSTWARLDNTTASQTIVSMQGRLVVYYDGTQYSAFLYQTGGNSYRANVSAPDPTNWTHLSVVMDSNQMTIYRGNTAGETVSTSTSNAVSGNFSAGNMDGAVEETRTWNTALNSTERQELIDHPTRPHSTRASARIMYDARSQVSTLPVFGSPASLQLYNADIVDGFDGEELVEGVDYRLSGGERNIVALSEKLEGAHAVYATYDEGGFGGLMGQLVNVGGSALGLVAIGLIVLAASKVNEELGGGF